MNSLGSVVKDKFGDRNNYVEIKLFPGLKVTSRFIPFEQAQSNLKGYINNHDMLFLSADFSRNFKDSVKELHNNLEWNQLFLISCPMWHYIILKVYFIN